MAGKILILLFCLLALGLFGLQHKNNDTYTNSTLGFSLKVPKGAVVCPIQNGIDVVFGRNCTQYSYEGFVITVPYDSYAQNPQDLENESFDEWVKRIAFDQMIGDNVTRKVIDRRKIKEIDTETILTTYPTVNLPDKTSYDVAVYLDKTPRLKLFPYVSADSLEAAQQQEASLFETAKNITHIQPTTGDFEGLLTIDYTGKDGWGSIYPFHYFTIYHNNGLPAKKVESDRGSNFVTSLPEGEYFVYTQGKRQDFTIKRGAFTGQGVSIEGKKDGFDKIQKEGDAIEAEIFKNGELSFLTKLRFFLTDLNK